jgi:hypothetical protein
VIDTLRSHASRLSQDDLLYVYFAGHGLALAGEVFLATVDADHNRPRETALSSADLDAILSASRARGVLLILDCCGGAGFAENASQFFRTLHHADFRILLSASRASQNSWETPDGKGTVFTQALIALLRGELDSGSEPDFIYFSEMLQVLQLEMDEQLSLRAAQIARQECVFTGVFSKDPLVFVRRSLSLDNIAVRTTRYSRRYLYQVTRRATIVFAAAIAFAVGCLFTYLDQSRFADVAPDGKIRILSGVPGIHVLGFPKLRWGLDLPAEYARLDSPLRRKAAIRGPLGQPILPTLFSQLRPEPRALLHYWMGEPDSARSELEKPFREGKDELGFWGAPRLYALVAGSEEVPSLLNFARNHRRDVRAASLIALLQRDVGSAVQLALSHDGLNDFSFQRDILVALQPPCNEASREYLGGIAVSEAGVPNVSNVVDCTLRLGCDLNTREVLTLARNCWAEEDFQTLAAFLDGRNDPELIRGLVEYLHSPTSAERRIGGILLILAVHPIQCEEASRFARSGDPLIASAAAFAAGRCGVAMQKLPGFRSGSIAARTAAAWLGTMDEFDADTLASAEYSDITRFLDALSVGGGKAAEKAARALLVHDDPVVRQRAARNLRELRARPMDAPFLLSDNSSEVQEEACAWFLAVDPDGAKAHLLSRLADESIGYIPRLLASVSLADDELRAIRSALERIDSERTTAAAILASHAPIDEVLALLRSPDPETRDAAASTVAGHREFATIVRAMRFPNAYPSRAEAYVNEQFKIRNGLMLELQRVSEAKRNWRIGLILRCREDLSDGVRAWLQSMRR